MKSLDGDAFLDYVDSATSPVLVLFHADWCGPCQRFKPAFAKSSVVNGSVEHVMSNADHVPSFLAKQGIMSVPTVALFENGKIKQLVKSRTAESIAAEISI